MFPVKQTIILLRIAALLNSDCLTNINRDHNNILLIQNGTIREPDDVLGNIKLKTNEVLTLACPGGKVTATKTIFVDAKCKGGDQFTVGKDTYSAKQLTCSQLPQSIVKNVGKCLNTQLEFLIGFDIPGKGFISQIDLCFNNISKATLYAHAVLSSKIGAAQEIKRPAFKTNPPYITRELGDRYKRTLEVTTLEQILSKPGQGLPSYINRNALMDAGHCAACADFIYKVQQTMTFHYINAAPQWNAVNNRNWNLLESNLRELVKQKKKDYDVYTGTYGVLKLLKKNSTSRARIYLDHVHYRLPSPEYYWKVVVEKGGDTGIAFIGMNNVFEKQNDPCDNIIKQVTWMNFGKWDNYEDGYIVACDVNKFKHIAGLKLQLPTFPTVKHLLLK